MKKKKAARLKARLRDLQHQNDELLEDIRRLVGVGAEGSEYLTKEKWKAVFSVRSKAEKAMWSGSATNIADTSGFVGLLSKAYDMQGEPIPEGVSSIKVPISSQRIQSQCGETPRNLFGKSTTTEPGERNTNY